jgi:transcriptional regulator with XRE-family HTH domain
MRGLLYCHVELVFMVLSEKIKELRKRRDWSQEIVANKLNISLNSYGAIERGETNIKLSRIYELAEIFEVDVCILFATNSANGDSFRRKEDQCRRIEDISIESYKLLEFENLRLEKELEKKKLEEVVHSQSAIILEKTRQVEFLEYTIEKILSSIGK